MKAADVVPAIKAHLAKRGFGDIEVNMSGGYDPTQTAASAPLIQAQIAVLKRAGIEPVMWPRNAGSYPGFVFTGAPLKSGVRTFRSRSRQRRACAGRILRDRVDQSENPGIRRRGDVVRRISLRAGEVEVPNEWLVLGA